MDAKNYTQSQVFYGLREAWEAATGTDDHFIDTQIYTFMKADGAWDDLDLADVFRGLEEFFGFACSHQEWDDFFGFDVAERDLHEWEQDFAPRLTFGALATFIAARTPVVATFEPVPVFGRYCETAGIFDGIQKVAAHTTPYRARFAPSSRILAVMRGRELDRFWTHLRWMTENSIPALPSFWRDVTFIVGFFCVVLVVGSWFAAAYASTLFWFVAGILGAAALYATAHLYKRFTNPLPTHIVSFRDLTMLIAENRNRAA